MLPKVSALIYIAFSSVLRFQFLYILPNTCYLFSIVSLVGVKLYYTVILIFISQIVNDVEHILCPYYPFVYPLWKNIYSLF